MLNTHKDKHLILGPPGTGKTTTLTKIMEEYLLRGYSPSDIGFVSFTTAAADEAKNRVIKLLNCNDNELTYFRTIHSLCFRQLGLTRDGVFTKQHEIDFGALVGLDIRGSQNVLDGLYGMSQDDRYLFIENQSRIRNKPLRQVWQDIADDSIDWLMLERVQSSIKKYKDNNNLVDFTDMLHMMLKYGSFPRLRVLFVDEAQDLSHIQWKVIEQWSAVVDTIYIAGDDDQAIHAWAGADVEKFISLKANTRILRQSYRINKKVHTLANGVISRVSNRIKKDFNPKPLDGELNYCNNYEEADLNKGSWLLLARNGYSLNKLQDYCESQGFLFSSRYRNPLESAELKAIIAFEKLKLNKPTSVNEAKLLLRYMYGQRNYQVKELPDKTVDVNHLIETYKLNMGAPWYEALLALPVDIIEYFRAVRRNGEKIIGGTPRIKISTIHGAKGAEADNVLLLSDISPKVYNSMGLDSDNEHRVFYVGCTRAIHNLTIVTPNTRYYYDI